MRQFFRFWFIDSLSLAVGTFKRSLSILEGTIAVSETIRNLGKPLFQDYTWQGRLIGFFLRLFRIVFGLIAYGFIAVGHLIVYVFFLVSPFIFAYSAYSGYANTATQTRIINE